MRIDSRFRPFPAVLGLVVGLAVVAGRAAGQSPDPSGTWNLETRNLAERATGGVRNVLLRIERRGDGYGAEMTSPRNAFLDVQEFRYEQNTITVRFGAYLYTLTLEDDRLVGTMVSPVDTVAVSGRRQQGTMYAGDVPAEYVATRTGMLGHRVHLLPPEEEANPGGWVRSRIGTVEDFALILRGIPVSFANPEAFEAELAALAGRRVRVTGAWVGERYRIDEIEADSQ